MRSPRSLCPEAKWGGARPRPHGPAPTAPPCPPWPRPVPHGPPPTGGSTLPSRQAWEEWPGSHVGQGRLRPLPHRPPPAHFLRPVFPEIGLKKKRVELAPPAPRPRPRCRTLFTQPPGRSLSLNSSNPTFSLYLIEILLKTIQILLKSSVIRKSHACGRRRRATDAAGGTSS